MLLARALIWSQRSPRARRAAGAGLMVALPALSAGIAAAGCFTTDAGLAPPLNSFYFPTGLVASPGGEALYVTNSDFDLRYNGGTVQAIALAGAGGLRDRAHCIQEALEPEALAGDPPARCAADFGITPAAPCGALGANPSPVLHPGPCAPLDAQPFIRSQAIIGAFASGALLVPRPAGEGGGARLFIPVRGDPSITFFNITDPLRLECGADADGRCSSDFRVGEDPYESPRALRLPLEPVGMVADPSGQAIVTAHQTQTAASLITSRWGEKPVLQFVLAELSPGPTELAALPIPGLVAACGDAITYPPGFLLTYRAAPVLDLLRYHADEGSKPPRPYLTRATSLAITVNTGGGDSRGIAVDGSERRACEEACDAEWLGCEPGCHEDRIACMAACTEIPVRFFIANRSPASLIVGKARTVPVATEGQTSCGAAGYTSAYEVLELEDTVALAYGPSRVTVGHIIGEDGQPHLRAFAAAFDSRFVFSYDPEARRVDAIIRTGRGPHAIAVDTGFDEERGRSYSFMYVGHFTDSYIGVVDLDARRPNTFGSMVLTLGRPQAPPESQ